MNRPWVLFDASFLAHRARSVIKGLEHNEMATNVIFGFFQALQDICRDPRIASNRAAICFDSRQSHRKAAFPAYKENRVKEEKTPEEWAEIMCMKEQVELLRTEILPEIGFPCHRQTGLEADDMLAQHALQVETSDTLQCVLVTSDGDLFQCVTQYTIHFFDPNRDLYLDHLGVWKKKGAEPQDWARVKAIGGCTGDCVPGVEGVGEKTAINYVNGHLPKHYQKFKAIESPEGQAVIARNLPLVTLPHARTRELEVVEPKYNPDAFFRWAEKLGFTSYLGSGRRRAWEAFFAGNMMGVRQEARKREEARLR